MIRKLTLFAAASLSTFQSVAHAQEANKDASASTLPAVQVSAQKANETTRPLETGSHLGLSSLETPASVEQIDRATLVERGDASIVDAVSRATGISESPHPGNGGSELAARGFVGSSSVKQLFDGVRPYGAIGVTYPFDTWAVDHIDVLRGPPRSFMARGRSAEW